MYVGSYFLLALCRCYSLNISYIPLLSSMNHTPITYYLISLTLDFLRYLGYACDLQHLKTQIFAYLGAPILAQNGQFMVYGYYDRSSRLKGA